MGAQYLYVKLRGENLVEAVHRRGGKQCFSLVMYGLCGNNALYSANLYSCLFSF